MCQFSSVPVFQMANLFRRHVAVLTLLFTEKPAKTIVAMVTVFRYCGCLNNCFPSLTELLSTFRFRKYPANIQPVTLQLSVFVVGAFTIQLKKQWQMCTLSHWAFYIQHRSSLPQRWAHAHERSHKHTADWLYPSLEKSWENECALLHMKCQRWGWSYIGL